MSEVGKAVRNLVLFLLLVLACPWHPASARGLREVVGRDREHVVQAGENLYGLAQQYGLAIEHLAFANSLSPSGIHVAPGTRLRVPGRRVLPANPPADGLVVNLPERGVFLFRGGRFDKFYPLAIGQPGRFATPQGSFTLASRVVNPTWLPPEWAGLGQISVPAGPDNPLGDRWMGLSLPGVGLHATTSPMSVGQAASHGCMRMYPASARELFDKVWVGMPVRIEYETAKAGYDAQTGEFCLVAFPDVYGQADPRYQAPLALEELGLGSVLEDRRLASSFHPDGVVRSLLTADVRVLVQGAPLDLDFPPILWQDSLWASADLARALGLGVCWDAGQRTIEVRSGSTAVLFGVGATAPPRVPQPAPSPSPSQSPSPSPEDPGWSAEPGPVPTPTPDAVASPPSWGGSALLVGGRALVPVRPLLDTFGLPFRWEPQERTLYIEG